MESVDLVATPVSGSLDPGSGFAYVAIPSQCIAWNYQKVCHKSVQVTRS